MQAREAHVYGMLNVPINAHTRSLCEHSGRCVRCPAAKGVPAQPARALPSTGAAVQPQPKPYAWPSKG